MVVSPSHGQTIQTGAFFCDDGSGGVRRVRCDCVLYSSRSARRTPEERAAYAIGERAGEQAPHDARLPAAAELNMIAQRYFEEQGSGNKQNWDLAFENGYEGGFKKTHPQ